MKAKRLFSLILCVILLSGCSGKFGIETINFYYPKDDISFTSSAGVIDYESEANASDSIGLMDVMERYLEGPFSSSLRSPFPEDLKIVKAEQTEDSVILVFSRELGSMYGMDLTLACACITKTCLELTGAKSVTIQAQGTTLDGAEQITMDAESLILLSSQ